MTAPPPNTQQRRSSVDLPPRARKFLDVAWRVVAFYFGCALLHGALQLAPAIIVGPRVLSADLFQWTFLASVVVTTYVMLRLVDKLPWGAVGLDRAAASPRLVVRGAAFGGLTIAAASLLLLSTHMLRIDPTTPGSWWGEAGHSAVAFLPPAAIEELFIRGYTFALLRRTAGWKLALIVTSVAFGMLHAWNPGADAESILAVIVAGFFLGAILLATRSLYATIAAHFAWNWVMAGALHMAVSGIPSGNPDYRVVDSGPDWLTGGPWGPEGGLAAVAAMFVGIFYLYGRYLRRMEWKA